MSAECQPCFDAFYSCKVMTFGVLSLCAPIGIQGLDPEQDGRVEARDPLPGRRHHCRNSLCRQPHSWSVALA